MNVKLTFAILALLYAPVSFADVEFAPRPRPRVTDTMKLQFEKQARESAKDASAPAQSDLDVVELAPIEVRASDPYFIFDHEKRSLKRIPFTWKNGGTLTRYEGPKTTTELKFQYDPANNGVQLLSISF